MYQQITNPQTGKKFSIYSKEGKALVRNYLNQIGGKVWDAESGNEIHPEPTGESPNPLGDRIVTKEERTDIRSQIGPMHFYASQKVANLCTKSKVIYSAVYRDTLVSAELAIQQYKKNPSSIETINSVLIFGPLLEHFMEALLNKSIGERARITRIKDDLNQINEEVKTKVASQKGGSRKDATLSTETDLEELGRVDEEAEVTESVPRVIPAFGMGSQLVAATDAGSASVPGDITPFEMGGRLVACDDAGAASELVTTLSHVAAIRRQDVQMATQGIESHIKGIAATIQHVITRSEARRAQKEKELEEMICAHKLAVDTAVKAGGKQFDQDLTTFRLDMCRSVFLPVAAGAVMGGAAGYGLWSFGDTIVSVIGGALDASINTLYNGASTGLAMCFNPFRGWLFGGDPGCGGDDWSNLLWDYQSVERINAMNNPAYQASRIAPFSVDLGLGGELPTAPRITTRSGWWGGDPVVTTAASISMCVGYNYQIFGGAQAVASSLFWGTACVGGGALCCCGSYIMATGRSAATDGVILPLMVHSTALAAMATGVGFGPGSAIEAMTWCSPGTTTIQEANDYCTGRVPNRISGFRTLARERGVHDDAGFPSLEKFKAERAWTRERYLQFINAQYVRTDAHRTSLRSISTARLHLAQLIKDAEAEIRHLESSHLHAADTRDARAIEAQSASTRQMVDILRPLGPMLRVLDRDERAMNAIDDQITSEAATVVTSGALGFGMRHRPAGRAPVSAEMTMGDELVRPRSRSEVEGLEGDGRAPRDTKKDI